MLAMDDDRPQYLHEGEGRDIADEVKEVDDPAHAPATGRGGGVIQTEKSQPLGEPDVKE
jgi:hypothetical protein